MYLIVFLLFLMFRPPTRSTRTYTLFPYTTLFRSPFLILSCSSGENSMLRLPFVKSQPLKKLPFCSCPVIVRRGFEATPKRIAGPPVALVLPTLTTASKLSVFHSTSVSEVFDTCFSRL